MNPFRLFLTVLLLLSAMGTLAPVSQCNAESIDADRITSAIERASALLEKGVNNYPSHRSCFSCHHQALPLLAFSVHDLPADAEAFSQKEVVRSIASFTQTAFVGKQATLRGGGEIGGRALTVAYGLWTMDLAGTNNNATTDAMVEYLLKVQAKDGGWTFHSYRPPAASSRLMTSAVAVYGLRSYAHAGQFDQERLRGAYQHVLDWSREQPLREGFEDQFGQLWLEHMVRKELGCVDNDRMGALVQALLAEQREDGGWAQKSELTSDAYATGQAITLLAEVTGGQVDTNDLKPLERGIEFLLKTQKEDGSWHVVTRSKPVQVFFDNGDPHGNDQFISMMATSWGTAALKTYHHRATSPLSSIRVAARK
jgi:N-acyl-D-amino-acid deacylase